MRIVLAASLAALTALAACSADPRTSSTPMTPASAGNSSGSPQTANSLPRGDVVNAPRASATGNVSTTVTPARTY